MSDRETPAVGDEVEILVRGLVNLVDSDGDFQVEGSYFFPDDPSIVSIRILHKGVTRKPN